jgi:hypothetical protein
VEYAPVSAILADELVELDPLSNPNVSVSPLRGLAGPTGHPIG